MLREKSVAELQELLEKGEASAVDIAGSFLERIKSLNGDLNSFITVDEERVMNAADESDKRRKSGNTLSEYDGIPVAIKDNICTEGMKTTCASKILENFVSPYNATSYSRLSEKGFILLGKTNMDEFAMGSTNETSYFGPVKNPFNLSHVTGGSSGGSAASVSARMTPLALGSDTGGSIRLPAAFCGVVGIKPTYGRVSRYGLVAFASSLDQVGAFGNSIEDAGILLSVVSGYDSRDTTSVDAEIDFSADAIEDDVSGMVVGVPEEYFQGVDPEICNTINEKISELEESGARVEKISLKYTEYAIPVYYLIATAEASSNLARFDGIKYGYRSPGSTDLSSLYSRSRSEGFGKEVKRRIILGTFSLSSGYYDAYYLKALKGRKLIINDFKRTFEKVDVIITPTTTTTAPVVGELVSDPLQMYMSDILTISANLAGIPGLSMPVGLDENGMPIGLQIMGNHFQEKKILTVAKKIESTCESFKPGI